MPVRDALRNGAIQGQEYTRSQIGYPYKSIKVPEGSEAEAFEGGSPPDPDHAK